MQVTVHSERLFALLDALLERWEKRSFPYDKRDAVIPQTIIPDDLRDDKRALATFYFYACIYMRGGIESLQAFRALLRMRAEHPALFDPLHAQYMRPEDIQSILKKYIGWDSKAASKNWVENSWRLMSYWNGNPLLLFKGIRNYDEALRRLRNKLTKRDQRAAGSDGRGFQGFQPKMVSMLTYFLDWEGLLRPRFDYPTPADFHNFRLGFAVGAIEVHPRPKQLRTTEKLSKPWREAVMEYIVARRADPVKVADALWLYSLVMCGNSPIMATLKVRKGPDVSTQGQFSDELLPHRNDHAELYLLPRFRRGLATTCLRCVIRQSCSLAIPAAPYYQKGLLVLNNRFRIEEHLPALAPDTPIRTAPKSAPENLHLFGPDTS